MKHKHDADVTINVNVPKQDLEDLIDKVTDSAVTIIAAFTVAHILKSLFTSKPV